MHSLLDSSLFLVLVAFTSCNSAAASHYIAESSIEAIGKRQDASSPADLIVDLGYERYQGVANSSTGLNTWLGVRFAAPPTGQDRWQPPKAPATNRDELLQADTVPTRCPQSVSSTLPPGFNATGSEDCLFLSIYAPPDAKDLPVYVWIHGGGYAAGQGDQDLSLLVNTNNKAFIGVAMQYRLGAFGFLSSDEVKKFGVVNAGLLDQQFALQWIKDHIGLFGGDASQVTISGESAGAGSVIQHILAYGGSQGDSLFGNAHAASPYLPPQYGYADWVPSQAYYAFASAAGCFGPPALPQGNTSTSIFQCLLRKDTETLQNASSLITSSGKYYGSAAFVPVTDGTFLQQLPSQQLLDKKLNGVNLLVGSNANEGPLFTPQDTNSEDDYLEFVRNILPLFNESNIDRLLEFYPVSPTSAPSNVQYATNGTTSDTALNMSTFATGTQQVANNLHAETLFVCPAYWMAEAFTGNNRKAYQYQYSVPGAQHGADLPIYFGPPTEAQGEDFNRAVMTMLGNFVVHGDPSISIDVARGSDPEANVEAATAWPVYSTAAPRLLNLNITGGTPYSALSIIPEVNNITQLRDPGLRNDFQAVDAFEWEGERGRRCDFWRSVASSVPE